MKLTTYYIYLIKFITNIVLLNVQHCEATGNWTADSSTYVGCYQDNASAQVMTFQEEFTYSMYEVMTIDLCRNNCLVNTTYTYVGLHGYCYCNCGDVYATYRKLSGERCNFYCTGNNEQICGGVWVNSVYKICEKGYHGKSCNIRCKGHCKNDEQCLRRDGSCANGCMDGWTGSGKCDQDVNECDWPRRPCQQECHNTYGSYYCSCYPGYKLKDDGRNCEDINECEDNDSCTSHTMCDNTQGSYECSCESGYKLNADKHSCSDINECTSATMHHCDEQNGRCVNTDGGYACQCNIGYKDYMEDDHIHNCTDVNECEEQANPCRHEKSICTNIFGNYQCFCPEGFYNFLDNEKIPYCRALENRELSSHKTWLIFLTVIFVICIAVVGAVLCRPIFFKLLRKVNRSQSQLQESTKDGSVESNSPRYKDNGTTKTRVEELHEKAADNVQPASRGATEERTYEEVELDNVKPAAAPAASSSVVRNYELPSGEYNINIQQNVEHNYCNSLQENLAQPSNHYEQLEGTIEGPKPYQPLLSKC